MVGNVLNLVYTDTFIVVLFLVGTLIAGFNHRVNKLEDFAVGGRKFPLFAQICTIVATWMSGSSFHFIFSKIYSEGLYYYIASAGATFSFLIVAIFFIPRMGNFLGNNSIAESIGDIYGGIVRSITALTGIFCAIGYAAMQFKIFGGLFEFFWSLDRRYSIIAAGIIVTLYSATGGIKAVTYTDMVQFSAFALAIPFVGVFIWNDWYEKSDTHVSTIFENPMFDYKQVLDITNPELWAIVPLLIYFSIPNLGPTMSQRILMGSNINQIRKSFLISAIVLITLETLLSAIPFLLYAVDPNLDGNKLFGHVMTNYAYPGIKGLLIVGVISMAMSTADSWINSSSVFFANDLFAQFITSSEKKLKLAKIFSFMIGILAIFIATIERDLLKLMLSTTSFYYGLVTPILISVVFGFRTKKVFVFISMLTSFCYLLYIIVSKNFDVPPENILIAMLINVSVLFSLHYFWFFITVKENNPSLGWIGNSGNIFLKQLRKRRRDFFIKLGYSIKNFNILSLCIKYAPKDLKSSLALGVYYIFSTITTMYANIDVFNDHSKIMIYLYESIMLIGLIMATYFLWPNFISNNFVAKFSSVIWFGSIFYVLFFLSSLFAMLTSFNSLQLAVFTANTFVAFLLVGWRTSLAFLGVGFILAWVFFSNFFALGDEGLHMGSPLFISVYLLTLISTIVLLFIKPKEEHSQLVKNMLQSANQKLNLVSKDFDKISNELFYTKGQLNSLDQQMSFKNLEIAKLKNLKNDFISNFRKETHSPVTGIISMAEILYDLYHQLDEEEKQRYLIEIAGNAKKLVGFLDNIVDLSSLSDGGNSVLEIKSNSISDIIYKQSEICKKVFFSPIMKIYQEFVFDIQNDFYVDCDAYYIGQVCSNIMTNAINYSDSGFILVKCEKISKNEIEVSVRDEGVGIPENEINKVFDPFYVCSNISEVNSNRGLGLTISQKIIQLHGGVMSIKNNDTRGVTCSFTLRLS
ncbi:MAG: hypothetical protein ISN64_03715 [Rickettsia sp.]|nr:hypothetical protein [Rickettsia sp.]